jgi:hypothetical protein
MQTSPSELDPPDVSVSDAARTLVNRSWERCPDRSARTLPARSAARRAQRERLRAELDPDWLLPKPELERRLALAWHRHFSELSKRANAIRWASRKTEAAS